MAIKPGIYMDAYRNYRDPWGRAVSPEDIYDENGPEDQDEEPETGEVLVQVEGTIDYGQMSVDELKAELRRRQEAGHRFDTGKIRKKSDLIRVLMDNDAESLER